MEHCDNCQKVIKDLYSLEDRLTTLTSQLEIAQTQVKILREENNLLKSNIKVPNKPRRQNMKTQSQIQECLEEIEKLKQVIRVKDEIIQCFRQDDISESGTVTLPNPKKKVKL